MATRHQLEGSLHSGGCSGTSHQSTRMRRRWRSCGDDGQIGREVGLRAKRSSMRTSTKPLRNSLRCSKSSPRPKSDRSKSRPSHCNHRKDRRADLGQLTARRPEARAEPQASQKTREGTEVSGIEKPHRIVREQTRHKQTAKEKEGALSQLL
jgi:hypothetical protein